MLERSMVERLIRVIEKNAKMMTEDLRTMILRDPRTLSFQVLDERKLYAILFELYSHLGKWLLGESEKAEIPSYYSGLGELWFEEGFALHQIVQVLITTKRHVWDIVVEKGMTGTAKELDAAVDLITILHRFFDMAIYYLIVGYYRPLAMKMERLEREKNL